MSARLAILFLLLQQISAMAFEGPWPVYNSEIDGFQFATMIRWHEFGMDSPTWQPGKPLPVEIEVVKTAAKAELARHAKRPQDWRLSGYDIIGYRDTTKEDYWFFVVHFSAWDPKVRNGTFVEAAIPVNTRGVAMKIQKGDRIPTK
jgi:hypothetical protein